MGEGILNFIGKESALEFFEDLAYVYPFQRTP